jgi:hypothetical protein
LEVREGGNRVFAFAELPLRIGVGGLLLVAGIAKLRVGRAEVVRSVVGYGVLPPSLASIWARLLPLIEVALGMALITAFLTTTAAAAAAALMIVITVAVAQALLRGRVVPCGCFGPATKLLTWRVVARNAVVIAALTGLAIGG